jgi:hypothetical protein
VLPAPLPLLLGRKEGEEPKAAAGAPAVLAKGETIDAAAWRMTKVLVRRPANACRDLQGENVMFCYVVLC